MANSTQERSKRDLRPTAVALAGVILAVALTGCHSYDSHRQQPGASTTKLDPVQALLKSAATHYASDILEAIPRRTVTLSRHYSALNPHANMLEAKETCAGQDHTSISLVGIFSTGNKSITSSTSPEEMAKIADELSPSSVEALYTEINLDVGQNTNLAEQDEIDRANTPPYYTDGWNGSTVFFNPLKRNFEENNYTTFDTVIPAEYYKGDKLLTAEQIVDNMNTIVGLHGCGFGSPAQP